MVWQNKNALPRNFKTDAERKAFEKFYHIEIEDKPPRPLKWYATPELLENGLYTLQTVFKGKNRICLIARFDGFPLWITPWESYAGRMSRASFKKAIQKLGHYLDARMVEVKPLAIKEVYRPSEQIICVYSIMNGLTVLPSRNYPQKDMKNFLFALHLQGGIQDITYNPPVKVIADNLKKYRYCEFTADSQKIKEILSDTKRIAEFKEFLLFGEKGVERR